MISKPEAPSLYGLVLAGGKSTRMGQDKALLHYHGKPQLDVCFELLGEVCEKVFVSTRADQPRPGFPTILDPPEASGPITGILAALQSDSQHAWLAIGCDLPNLNRATLDYLIKHRNASKIATAFISANDGLPEPLCAIYEPAALAAMRNFRCPRKALINLDFEKLALPDPRALDNVNTPEELQAVRPSAPRTVHIQYFAMLREARGMSGESLTTTAATPAELYDQLALPVPRKSLKVAINDEFARWDSALKAEDLVTFIPPTAGG